MIRILPDFVPAKPTPWFIRAAQTIVGAELAFSNRLLVADEDLEILRQLPKDAGIILASNHADETDPLVCLSLSSRFKRRFLSMCNREAFDEIYGLAGLILQRLGYFSVKRGAHDSAAKDYAIKTVRSGEDVLVIFPEGEIYYLNEVIQPFHTGAVEICLQAILENRKTDPNWTACILPMVIKYHYDANIEQELEKRIAKMEADLSLKPGGTSLPSRLLLIQQTLLNREKRSPSPEASSLEQLKLTQDILSTEKQILSEIEQKRQDRQVSLHATPIDRAWQLEAEIRSEMLKPAAREIKEELEQELHSLEEVAQLSSWRPGYWSQGKSLDRLAEGILKMERELYRIKRPRQLAKRKVQVKFAAPIDMGRYVSSYIQDPHTVRHQATTDLHEQIQALIDSLIAKYS
jgi:1-acyl-sn-glycerol-3-phosphate acyltransferase